ncbi:hypothetical protein Y030_5170 [Burkholderia pseudomallei MSHR332]|nr:hypothetical protein Y030_5170 [Burkholderia pseudomallei MSHR332]
MPTIRQSGVGEFRLASAGKRQTDTRGFQENFPWKPFTLLFFSQRY